MVQRHDVLGSREEVLTTTVKATADTVDLGPAHPPKEDSIIVFSEILPELKKSLVHLRHDYNSAHTYPPSYRNQRSIS